MLIEFSTIYIEVIEQYNLIFLSTESYRSGHNEACRGRSPTERSVVVNRVTVFSCETVQFNIFKHGELSKRS